MTITQLSELRVAYKHIPLKIAPYSGVPPHRWNVSSKFVQICPIVHYLSLEVSAALMASCETNILGSCHTNNTVQSTNFGSTLLVLLRLHQEAVHL